MPVPGPGPVAPPFDAGGPAAKRRILFLCHCLEPLGGGEAVAAWMLQALAPVYDVTILTWETPDLAALDRMFGTSIAGLRFEIRTPSSLASWLVDRIPDDSGHQRGNYLTRMAKRLRHDYAAVIACTFEAEVGQPALQYIHYPYLARIGRGWTVAGDAPLAARIRGVLSGRTRAWMLISGYSFERARSNRVLTNSHWTQGEIARYCGIASEVLYPPAPGDFAGAPWERRQDEFVAIGRMVPEKRHDWIVETMAQVRREWPGLRLHICGSAPSLEYLKRLEESAAKHGDWVRIHRDLSRKDLLALLGNCRYGIHAFVEEHFGIAPAEMARAGSIPFVHASGGQVEIVDGDPRLCYTTAEDAAAKILAVMRDAEMQHELRDAVYRGSQRFTTETFIREFLAHVANFIAARNATAASCLR